MPPFSLATWASQALGLNWSPLVQPGKMHSKADTASVHPVYLSRFHFPLDFGLINIYSCVSLLKLLGRFFKVLSDNFISFH